MAKRNRTLWISLCVALVAAALFGAYYLFLGGGQQGAKQVALTVTGADGETLYDDTVRTDVQTLGELLDEKELATFQDSSYGRYITGVCGLVADEGAQQWWYIGINGEDAQVGADDLTIADGDSVVLTLKTGY